jgi:hypothetical protein
MIRLLRWLTVLIVIPLSLPVLARPKHKARAQKAAKVSGVAKTDLDAKALVRKRAPIVLEERYRGDHVRLNKDGTFAKESQMGSFTSQGHWKVKSGKLKLKWNTGEEYSYRLLFSGRTPLIAGQKPSKSNHYVLKSAE